MRRLRVWDCGAHARKYPLAYCIPSLTGKMRILCQAPAPSGWRLAAPMPSLTPVLLLCVGPVVDVFSHSC